MVCEAEQAIYETAFDAIDAARTIYDTNEPLRQQERQQEIWAIQAADMQATRAFLLLNNCLNMQGGGLNPPPPIGEEMPRQMQPGLFDADQLKAAMECVRKQIERRRIDTKK
jgi:hypothetical protein